jgi:hypothetical protein
MKEVYYVEFIKSKKGIVKSYPLFPFAIYKLEYFIFPRVKPTSKDFLLLA